MSTKEQIDRDLADYLDKEPNLRRHDRMVYLRALFTKHLEINQLEHVINHYDLYTVIDEAKRIQTSSKVPMHISSKRVEGHQVVHVSIMESFMLYLNRMNLLKKLTKFDYTEK